MSVPKSGTSRFFLEDRMGTVGLETDQGQAVSATRTYDAFGSMVGYSGSSPSSFGYAGGYGYQEDATGLKLLGHRYYDPSTGRFLTRDPIRDGRNWYAYCDNNPLRWVDPDGLQELLVPPAPNGVNVRKNVKEVRRLWEIGHIFLLAWIFADKAIYNKVRNGGEWDFKQKGRQYEPFGNFHYGIVMAAYGLDEETALRAAGWAQQRSGNSEKEDGHPLGAPPYGDDPKDQYWIKMGYRYYEEVILKSR